jgi:general secretion pathway protein G
MKNTKRAFTLVEMLIVIVIIGILAAALIPRLTGIQERARDTARQAAVNQLNSAVQLYSVDNAGAYPNALNATILDASYLNEFPTNGGFGSAAVASCTRNNGDLFAYGTGAGYAITAGLENDNGGNAGDCTLAPPSGNGAGFFKIYSN